MPDWRDVETWPFPLSPAGFPNPVFTRYDVTDSSTWHVADPFVFREGDRWYLFFEACRLRGRIALATSSDGVQWKFERTVISAGTHLSFPCVFAVGPEHYMVLESGASGTVPIYRAVEFPDQWELAATLVSGRAFADPVIFRRDGSWWMFVSDGQNNACYLYYSDRLFGPWREHPQSPVVTGWWRSRAGGPVIQLQGSRLLRVAQDDTPVYGRAVRVFEVDLLTRTAYAEHEIPESPVLTASGAGWNAEGMHQCSLWWRDGRWLALVDGHSTGGTWSIGCYLGGGEVTNAPLAGGATELRLIPNPVRAGGPRQLTLCGAGTDHAREIEVFDASGARRFRGDLFGCRLDLGRTIRRDGADGSGPSSGVFFWRVNDERKQTIGKGTLVVTP